MGAGTSETCLPFGGDITVDPAQLYTTVLDSRLRVRGVARLRVIDASVMPRITSGNTNAPTYVIAEKGAAAVLEALRRG